MSPLATTLWLANLACDLTGNLSFKAASLRARHVSGLQHWLELARGGFLWLGIGAFIFEFFLWVGFLSLVPLAQGVMMASVNIIGVMLGGRLLFAEALTASRCAAIGAIALGVALVGWGGS
jgi:drug/metabolite transporter (DMT)-like permease